MTSSERVIHVRWNPQAWGTWAGSADVIVSYDGICGHRSQERLTPVERANLRSVGWWYDRHRRMWRHADPAVSAGF